MISSTYSDDLRHVKSREDRGVCVFFCISMEKAMPALLEET
jgi:hypothetical protein